MTIGYLLAIPVVSAFCCLASGTKAFVRFFFVAGAVLLAAAGEYFVFTRAGQGNLFAFGGNLFMDPLGALFAALIVALGLLSAVYAGGYLFEEGPSAIPLRKLRRYGFFFHLFLFTMLLTVFANNLGIMWISIEGTTLASAFLVNIDDKKSSVEAAWKYLILCSVGIALALFGIILVYYSAALGVSGGGNYLLNWTFLAGRAKELNPQVMRLAFVFILVGYGTKAGLAPFHSWLPDAHSQAPSPVSALLSGVLLSCATLGILRFHILTKAATESPFSGHLLIFFGVLSVAVAVPFILDQKDYKRLFAYSSVEHMGLVAAGLGFGGAWGLYGALLHVVNHAFGKSLLFFCSGHLLHQFGTKEIGKIRGILKVNPLLGGAFFAGIMAITGMPPFNIFVSKFFILCGGFAGGHFFACGILLFLLVFIFAGFLRHACNMVFGIPEKTVRAERNRVMDGVLLAGVFFLVLLGVWVPGPLHRLILGAVSVAGGTTG
ncbi:MAG TPA: hydrogenase 4 subunit F [Candidatus Omnitrophota bacterium]|nr:hydrogenase 4 subunit F [Candidatus Omnitrophota bacterium]